jgi:hypothetical protein
MNVKAHDRLAALQSRVQAVQDVNGAYQFEVKNGLISYTYEDPADSGTAGDECHCGQCTHMRDSERPMARTRLDELRAASLP